MESLKPRLAAPPSTHDELLKNTTQEEYLAKLEKKLLRLQRGPTEKDKMVFKKGSAAELSRVANVNAESEHLESRQELLNSPLVSSLADTPSAHIEADTELLLGSTGRNELSSNDAEKRYLAADNGYRSSSSDELNEASHELEVDGDETPQWNAQHESRNLDQDSICASCTTH